MRTLFVGIGVIALLVGIVWILQGADILAGSAMSGNSFWLAVGFVLLVIGAAVTFVGAKSTGTRKAA